MTIDQKTVAKIARLSRVYIPEAEQQHYADDLSKIIGLAAQLDEVNVAGIEPLSNVNDMALRLREDVVTDGDMPEAVLANAPSKTADFFTVPKVIE